MNDYLFSWPETLSANSLGSCGAWESEFSIADAALAGSPLRSDIFGMADLDWGNLSTNQAQPDHFWGIEPLLRQLKTATLLPHAGMFSYDLVSKAPALTQWLDGLALTPTPVAPTGHNDLVEVATIQQPTPNVCAPLKVVPVFGEPLPRSKMTQQRIEKARDPSYMPYEIAHGGANPGYACHLNELAPGGTERRPLLRGEEWGQLFFRELPSLVDTY